MPIDDPEQSTKPAKPTWQVHARPIGATHEPWKTMCVEARSALQAQAILRRNGYEMVIESAMIVSANPHTIAPSRLEPLKCDRCGYSLNGLVIDSASVTCPECWYPQPLVAWAPDIQSRSDQNHPAVWIFAFIGMITFGLIVFVFILAVLM